MSSSRARTFEGFAPIFGEASPESEAAASNAPPSLQQQQHRPFVFRARALDSLHLELVASDFASRTLRRVLTVDELEDMRDDVGLSGTWDEFVDYVAKSLGSNGAKLLFSDGARTAKLIAYKSKGMPRITIYLNRIMESSASDVAADLSLSIYSALKDKDTNALKAHDCCQQLARLLSSEKEKTDNLQKQLDSYTFKSKRKAPKSKGSFKEASEASVLDTHNNFDTQQPSELPFTHNSLSKKASRNVFPVRRMKARGARLQDTEDNVDA